MSRPKAPLAPKSEPQSQWKCACGAFLVDIEEPYGIITQTCPRCDGPLELVNVVRGLYRRAGSAT
jgi:hypothetical protein